MNRSNTPINTVPFTPQAFILLAARIPVTLVPLTVPVRAALIAPSRSMASISELTLALRRVRTSYRVSMSMRHRQRLSTQVRW